jgi:two-component system, NarL family, invasion response regulator UvrY
MITLSTITVALVDDHTLFRKGLISLIEMIGPHIRVLFEADNGADMQKKITSASLPDIILMDVNMPEMDGFQSVAWLNKHYPAIKVLVISMIDSEESIIRMLKLGVKGYLSKDIEPEELANALLAIYSKGFYYTDFITGKLVHTLNNEFNLIESLPDIELNEKEKNIIRLACSEMTFNDIAIELCMSPKTVEGYRYALYEKLQVKSRVGMALYGVKHGLVTL